MTIIGGLFGAVGLVSGLCLRFPGFAIVLAASVTLYAAAGFYSGQPLALLLLDLVIALIAAQVGYFVAVLARVALQKYRQKATGADIAKPARDHSRLPPDGVGKPSQS